MPQGQTPRSGRLPDHTGPTVVLPREGRQGPPPVWPLPGTPTTREAQLWAAAWKRPQALIWERDGLEDLVGLYVRKSAEAEAPGSPSAVVETARRLADDLLLTIPAMRRAGVVIGEPASPSGSTSGTFRPGVGFRATDGTVTPINSGRPSGHTSSKDRFRRIPSGTATTSITPTTKETPA